MPLCTVLCWREGHGTKDFQCLVCGLHFPMTHVIWNSHSRILHVRKSALELNFMQNKVAHTCDPELRKKFRKSQTKKLNLVPGEMVQQWRVLTAHAEDPGSFLALIWQPTTAFYSILMGPVTLFWPLWEPGIHVVHKHACRQWTHTQIIK